MNGLTGTRRLARPVRLALAQQLGHAIDGAWWPYTSSLADELPQLISALHKPLGEIVDICINWSAMQGPRELYESVSGPKAARVGHPGRQRLMVVEGRLGCANLLVVPHMTSQPLGIMVMRRAAARSFSSAERGTDLFEIAECVMRAAQLESASWTTRMRAGALPPQDA
ncbi:hypothetical protein A5724_26285 [Mycobacterium sp. ACS1612]|uniref:DUF5994 family protein n=1 Tax=Mycobacterium sp. ACS1612 TaxID=1834117 RepID=UPI0007FF0195|nr:DUF5994 family protein [Mycobacterium sp. ACS1612]OBF28924.1 hypothetical protein A5724_26285 [Mycobacterium sp. ACS1612]